MSLDVQVAELQKAVATLQAQVNSMASKLTVKQAALLTESETQDLQTSLAALEARIAVLEGK